VSPRRTARRTVTRADPDAPIEGLPIVALVGRPNVGKSTLFNRVVGERQAVVEDRARTTRDRIYAVAEWNGRRFVVVDTGGLERRPNDPIEEKVQEQARLAIGEADVIVFLVDADAGEVPADLEAAEILRTASAPILVAANKADNPKRELEAAEFHRLGWEETYPISALHGKGVADLLDAIVWALPPESPAEIERKRAEREAEQAAEDALALGEEPRADEIETDEAEGPPRVVRVAIVGRPNVGKSSLLNKLLGEERAIVSDVPGTTRDAIDTSLDWNGTPVRLVDTAGIRRRGKVASGPAAEKFSTLRAVRAVGRADVAVLVVDASEGLTAQDAHVAGYVVEEGTGLVVAINKWDLVEKTGRTFDEYVARIRGEAPFLDFAPVVAVSARTGQRVGRVLDAALEVAAGRRRRVPTGELNRVLGDAAFKQPAPPVKGRRPRFYYATQVAIEPPTFVLFARDADAVHFSYKRYLENRLRDAFGFGGSPIRLIFRERSQVELEPRRRSPARGRPSVRAAARPGAVRRTARSPKTPKR
jgi:GTP-binding protein